MVRTAALGLCSHRLFLCFVVSLLPVHSHILVLGFWVVIGGEPTDIVGSRGTQFDLKVVRPGL